MSPEDCLDFDYAVEIFDLWLEARQDETVEKPAKKKKEATVQEPKYRTLRSLLGLENHQADFIGTPEENELVEQVLSGDLDYDALADLSDGHVSVTDLLDRMRGMSHPEP